MTEAGIAKAAGRPMAATCAGWLADGRLSVLIVLAAVVQQMIGHQNGDNSWLFIVAERILGGATPYVDVVEANPPASFLIYMPAAAIARALHLSTELVAVGLVFTFGLGVIAMAGAILRPAGLAKDEEVGFLLNAATFVLLFMPGLSFAEREHVAVLAMTPLMAVHSARAIAKPVPTWLAVSAGLCAGVAIAIKPHFALVAIFPLVTVMARRRSVLPAITSENACICAVLLGYATLVMVRYPEFFNSAQVLLDVYLKMKAPWHELLTRPWFLLNMALLVALPLRTRHAGLPTPAAMLLAGSAGFVVAYLFQGKGWVNHGLPGACFAILATAWLLSPAIVSLAREGHRSTIWLVHRRAALFGLAPLMIGAPLLFGVGLQFSGWEENPGLIAAVKRHAPPHPRLIAVSGELTLGHPLTRRVEGTWVGRPTALWQMAFAEILLQGRPDDAAYRDRLTRFAERDARMFRADVEAGRPDLILMDSDGPRLMRDPDVAAALTGYAPVETVGDVTLWARKP